MKKTRIISFLLALLMLAGCVSLFSACGGIEDGAVTLSGDEVEIDLSGYSAVFATALNDTKATLSLAKEFTGHISKLVGKTLTCYNEEALPADAESREILIGLTGRKESERAMGRIKGEGFAIEVSENKIAIVGTSHLHLVMAMEYFNEKYLSGASGKTVRLYERALATQMQSVVIGKEGEHGITFVVAEGTASDVSSGRDIAAELVGDFSDYIGKELFSSRTAKNKFLLKKEDHEEATGFTEFLVGDVDRDVARICRAELEATEYGFFVRNGSIVLTSPNGAALLEGKSMVSDLLQDALVKKDDKKSIVLPEGFSLKRHVTSKWVTDFPKPEGEGITLFNTMDDGDNSLQYYYVGEGVGADSYRAYCKQLTDAGYTVLTQNEIEGSMFATLVDPTGKFSLYVAYNAYAYADRYEYENNKYNAQYQKCIRVVSSPLDSVTLPDEGLLTPNSTYDRVTSSSIAALELYKDTVGMGYVITLEDGRLILFDGGFVAAPAPDDLWNLLSKTNERITGKPTSAENPVHIAAWILTHSHSDHSSAFLNVLKRFGSQIRMDYMLGNFPSKSSVYRVSSGDILDMSKEGAIKQYQQYVQGGFQFVKVHAGQKFYFANVEIEVLTTYEDLNPARIYTSNDTNTVTRFTMYNTNEQGVRVGEPVTSLWLGDANPLQSRHMCAMFGEYLESDMVQLAHHGNSGCEKDLYTLVNAKVLWFPVDYWRVELFALGTKHPTLRDVNLHALTLPRMQYVFVSGNNNTVSNDCNICLPFSAVTGEPDYGAIYDAVTGEPIAYDNVSAYDSVDVFVQAKNK